MGFINTLLFRGVAGPQDTEPVHHLEHDFNIKKKKVFPQKAPEVKKKKSALCNPVSAMDHIEDDDKTLV